MTLEELESQIVQARMEEMQVVDRLFQNSLRKMGIITMVAILTMSCCTYVIMNVQNLVVQTVAAIVQAISVYASLTMIDRCSKMPKTHHFTKKSDALCLQHAKLCIELARRVTKRAELEAQGFPFATDEDYKEI